MTTSPQTRVIATQSRWGAWREPIVRGSMILLISSGFVAATNLLYNLLVARMLGASGFGHASALYTLLMMMSAVSLSFQIVASKFIARHVDTLARTQIYATMLRRAWQVGLGITILIAATSGYLTSYFNLPQRHDLVLLALATGVYIPLGVRRGKMQGCCDFRSLGINVVVEVVVKFAGALLFLQLGWGVTGVMAAVLLSIIAAYLVGMPGAEYRAMPGLIKISPFGEGVQAILYFIGQVILSNLDILLVKHFFPPSDAGVYAAVALVGRVVFMLSWSVVSSMFPISAGRSNRTAGRSVLYTAMLLVTTLTSLFIVAVALAPEAVWTLLLGRAFLLGSVGSFSGLLTQYAIMTAVYSLAVVVMMYEISRRIGPAAWVQLGASVLVTGGIWWHHNSLSQVILVQLFVMCGLLVAVAIPLVHLRDASLTTPVPLEPFERLRRVPEAEVIAEFLRGEFYHPVFDPYRREFQHLVENCDLDSANDNFIRRELLFRRRGRLWRELPADTEWWEIHMTARDLARLQSFPRNEWRRFAMKGFYLNDTVSRIRAEIALEQQSAFLTKLQAIAGDLRESVVPDAVLLIGTDAHHPLTIIEGNHRMAAAMLAMPESAHSRFRFFCGLSPNMTSCCWHKTDLRSLTRYAGNTVRYILRDRDFIVSRTLREKTSKIQSS